MILNREQHQQKLHAAVEAPASLAGAVRMLLSTELGELACEGSDAPVEHLLGVLKRLALDATTPPAAPLPDAAGGQGMPTYLQVYRCKIKRRKQIEKEIPRERQGWWADVSPGQVLRLRPATPADLARCFLNPHRSKSPEDYMCETCENGSLVSKEALEYMSPEQHVFALVGGPLHAGANGASNG